MRSRRHRVFSSLLVVLVTTMVSGQAAAQNRSAIEVEGEFVSLGGLPTGYDPATGTITAVAFSTASGDWNGSWYEQLEFMLDPQTSDATGTALQIFTGRASDGTAGSLSVLEHFTVDGATHVLHGEGQILGGSGDWEGSRGYYVADGTVSGIGPGTWSAHWIRRH